MGWPQIIYLLVNVFSLGVMLIKGKTEVTFLNMLVGWVLITLPLLYWGGFFS